VDISHESVRYGQRDIRGKLHSRLVTVLTATANRGTARLMWPEWLITQQDGHPSQY